MKIANQEKNTFCCLSDVNIPKIIINKTQLNDENEKKKKTKNTQNFIIIDV